MSQVPILLYHRVCPRCPDDGAVDPRTFGRQLRYLQRRAYHSASLGELRAHLSAEQLLARRSVVLTFDDATSDHWAYVVPLLRRHGIRATFFVPTGLPGEEPPRPNMDDVWAGRISERELTTDGTMSWSEIAAAKESGFVDIESHSHWHARHPTGPRVLGFRTPCATLPEEEWGLPIYEDAPALTAPRFDPPAAEIEVVRQAIAATGRPAFFSRQGWRDELTALLTRHREQAGEPGAFEDRQGFIARVREELRLSRDTIESRLGHRPGFLAWPHGQADREAHALAREAGFLATLVSPRCEADPAAGLLARQHFGEEYRGPLQRTVTYWRFVRTVESLCRVGLRWRFSPVARILVGWLGDRGAGTSHGDSLEGGA